MMLDNQNRDEQMAVNYARKKFGANFGDVLTVADNIENRAFQLPTFEDFGGLDMVRDEFESSVTGRDLREADKYANTILGLWNDSESIEDESGQEMSMGQKQVKKMMEGLSDVFGTSMQKYGAKMQRLQAEMNEAEEGSPAYKDAESRLQKLSEESQADLKERQVQKKNESDARELCAKIVFVGPLSVNENVYNAIVQR